MKRTLLFALFFVSLVSFAEAAMGFSGRRGRRGCCLSKPWRQKPITEHQKVPEPHPCPDMSTVCYTPYVRYQPRTCTYFEKVPVQEECMQRCVRYETVEYQQLCCEYVPRYYYKTCKRLVPKYEYRPAIKCRTRTEIQQCTTYEPVIEYKKSVCPPPCCNECCE